MKKIIALILLCMLFAMPALAQEISITTGLPTDHTAQVMIVQFDNEPGARPQKGIASADIVYETETYQGGYTRYSAVFNDSLPEEVEALRSARIVHADIASEFGGWFIHYGGQDMAGTDVFSYMKDIGLNSVDCLKSSFGKKFAYRDSQRKAPNNVVLRLQAIRDSLDWSGMEFTSPLKFDAENYTRLGEDVQAFRVLYRSGKYEPSYVYNAEAGAYARYYNGEAFTDGFTGEQVLCENVIIMHADYEWFLGDSDRPVVELYGGNRADYFIGGKHFTGSWQREEGGVTTYLDENGSEVVFKPGRTYIQVLNTSRSWQID